MITKNIGKLINEQITKEQYAANYYLAMSAWFSSKDLDGIANYFRVQSKEELTHADKMYDYLIDVSYQVQVEKVEQPPQDFKDAIDVFERALAHEKLVTKSIFNIMKEANAESDYATINFLQWFVNEQVEEEASASQFLAKIKMVNDNPSALFLFDQELANRTLGTNTDTTN